MNTSHEKFDLDVSGYPDLPKLKGVFVTGTDTEVGKTLIAGAIARSLHKAQWSVEVFKPVATGCRRTSAGLVSEDAEFLAFCAESRRTLAEITPLRYPAAVAPNLAAKRAGQSIDLDALFQGYAQLSGAGDVVVVEGIGGLMCPISDEFWVIHFAKMIGLPVVIVARPGLGTINHTLLTIHAARSAGLRVAGVVINRYQIESPLKDSETEGRGDAVLAMHTNPTQIAQLSGTPILGIVPDEPENSVSDARIGPDTQFAIDEMDWSSICGLK